MWFVVTVPDHHQSASCSASAVENMKHNIAKSMSKLTIIGVYIRSTQMKWIMLFAKAIYIYRHGEHTAITHTPTERRISNFRPNMYIVRLIVHPSTNTPYNSSTTGTKNARVAKGKSDGFHTNTENNIEISVMCWAKSGSRERKKRGTRIYALFSCYGVHLSAYPNLFWLDSTENWMKISARFFRLIQMEMETHAVSHWYMATESRSWLTWSETMHQTTTTTTAKCVLWHSLKCH